VTPGTAVRASSPLNPARAIAALPRRLVAERIPSAIPSQKNKHFRTVTG
jgi:hypothetical protein